MLPRRAFFCFPDPGIFNAEDAEAQRIRMGENYLSRHPERSEGSTTPHIMTATWILRTAQDDAAEV